MEPLDEHVREAVMQRMDLTRNLSDQDILSIIMEEICCLGKEQFISMEQRVEIQKRVFHSLRKLDVLEELLEDDTITEIMVNGSQCIFVEREYVFSSKEKLEDVVQKIVAANNKVVNAAHPIVDTKLSDGSRINIVLPPIAIEECVLSIRKFSKKPITMEKLIAWNTLSEEVAEYIQALVQSKYNIFVSGATSSGKTTFYGYLLLSCLVCYG